MGRMLGAPVPARLDIRRFDTATAETDETARVEAWATAAGMIHDNVCFVTLAHGDTALAFTDEVQGYEPNPTGSESFRSVWLTNGGE